MKAPAYSSFFLFLLSASFVCDVMPPGNMFIAAFPVRRQKKPGLYAALQRLCDVISGKPYSGKGHDMDFYVPLATPGQAYLKIEDGNRDAALL